MSWHSGPSGGGYAALGVSMGHTFGTGWNKVGLGTGTVEAGAGAW
jgi:hypothetical protein